MAEGKFFVIRSQLNDLVLDVQDCRCEAGATVATWHFNGGQNQLFFEDYVNGVIRSAMDDNLVLEVQGDSLALNEFNPHETMQKWSTCGDRIQNGENPDSVLDIADHNAEPGARVCAWGFNGGPNQLFNFEYQPPRYCIIRSEMNGKVLDVKGANPDPGVKVLMYDQHEEIADNQTWYEDRYGVIRSKLNDCAIDTSRPKAHTGEYDPENPSQQWVKTSNRIVNRTDPSQCLDIIGAKDRNRAKLCSYEYKASDNQHWTFEYLG